MRVPRAPVILFAALAAGVAGRISCDRLSEDPAGKPRVSSSDTPLFPASPNTKLPPAVPGPRPESAAVLSASGASRLRLLMAWLPGAGEQDVLTMAVGMAKTLDTDSLEVRLLMARWAEVNPKSLLAWAESQAPGAGSAWKHFYVENALEAWARVDFEAAWAAAASGHRECRGHALLGLAAVDPEKCLSLLSADPSLLNLNLDGYGDLSHLVRRLAAANPGGAAAMLDKASAANRISMAQEIAGLWVKTDPAAAVAWIKTLPPAAKNSSLDSAVEWIAAHAPAQVPELMAALPPGELRSTLAAADFRRLASDDPAAAQRQLDAMPSGAARQYERAILMQERLKAGDLQSARELAGLIGWHMHDLWLPSYENNLGGFSSVSYPAESPSAAMKSLISRIAAANPEEAAEILSRPGSDTDLAAAAAKSNPAAMALALTTKAEQSAHAPSAPTLFGDPTDEDTGDSGLGPAADACQKVIETWAARDPAAAAAWVAARPADGSMTPSLMISLFGAWADTDPAAMLAWASTREGAAKLAWQEVVNHGPDLALSHLDTFFGSAGEDSVETLLLGLNTRPAEARDIIRRMPDDMDVSLTGVMLPWLKENPEEASAWVKSLPAGEKRNHAAADIAQWAYEANDFESASRWALSLPEDSREDLLPLALEALRRQDPAKVKALIRASSLTAEEKEELLNPDSQP